MCSKPYVAELSSHAALTKESKMSDSRTVVSYAGCLYMLYSFCDMREEKKEKEQNRNFHV